MSSQKSGNCCVCGEPADMRCSACGQGNIDLFFCSTKHQKLVWPMHKPVCGPGKADMHAAPDLTQAEADLFSSPTFLEDCSQHLKLGFDHFEERVGLPVGSIFKNARNRSIQPWLATFADSPEVYHSLLYLIASTLSSYAMQWPAKVDPLALPAHAFKSVLQTFLSIDQNDLDEAEQLSFAQEGVIWVGLLRIIDGRVATNELVTHEQIRARAEQMLQALEKAGVDLSMNQPGADFVDFFSKLLAHTPAMAGYNVYRTRTSGRPRVFVRHSSQLRNGQPTPA
ncbi:hypothetical protein JCM10908_000080 [Rhodotorula pacifica]|uniref:zinc finger MYND domain-containing protein n=1 Tax=Rhodotorula pacifica TaxID=1495444 RepID=UPI00316EB50D